MNPNNNKRAVTMFFIYDVVPTEAEAAFAANLVGSVRFRNANYINDTDTPEEGVSQVVSFGRIPLPYQGFARVDTSGAVPAPAPVGNPVQQPQYQAPIEQQNFDAANSQFPPAGQVPQQFAPAGQQYVDTNPNNNGQFTNVNDGWNQNNGQ